MQMQLPIFPENTKLINSSVGFFRKNDFIFYLHNGSPVYCHSQDDLNTYRYVLANLVATGLCTISELSRALGVNIKNIQRYKKALDDKGTSWFFNREDNRGQCHKMNEDKVKEAQSLLDEGYSQKGAAKRLGISEGAIRYHLRSGKGAITTTTR
jgi:transposase